MNSRRVGMSRSGYSGRSLLSNFNKDISSGPKAPPKPEPEEIESSTQEDVDAIRAPPMASSDTDPDDLPDRGDLGGGRLGSRKTATQPESDTSPPSQQSKSSVALSNRQKRSASQASGSVGSSPRSSSDAKRTKQDEAPDPAWMTGQDDSHGRNAQNKKFARGYGSGNRKPQRARAPRMKASASVMAKRESMSPKPVFKMAARILDDSSPEKPRSKLKKPSYTALPDSSPAKSKFRKTKSSHDSDEEVQMTQIPLFRTYQVDNSDDELEGGRPTVRVQDNIGDNDADFDSPLSDILSDDLDLRSGDEKTMKMFRCQVCGSDVEKEIRDNFNKSASLSLDQQMKFCTHHKKQSALQTWKDKGWPDIKWHQLDDRIERHHPLLERVLMGKDSHFRSMLDDKVREGRDRTLKKSERQLTPGYYGLRGFRAMSDHIVEHFSKMLRKQAVGDRLVSSRGHTGYVQLVMVPELAVQLIMEDLGLGADEAREVMSESADIGELLNDEIKDVVLLDQDENDSDSDGFESL